MKKSLDVSFLGQCENPTIEQLKVFYSHCFEELYAPILAIAYDHFQNETEAEDAAADFFEKLMNWPISRFKEQQNLVGYILQSARNYCIDRLRAKKRERNKQIVASLESVFHVPDRAKSIDQVIITNETLERVIQAIAQLPEPQQMVLMLKAQGYEHQEIATKLGITESASTSRVNRAREKLKTLINHNHKGENKVESSP